MTTNDEYDDDIGSTLVVYFKVIHSIPRLSQDERNSPNMNINCVWDYNNSKL